MVSKLKLLLLLAISIGLFGCTSDQASGGFHDALFFATGIVSEVNIDGGTKRSLSLLRLMTAVSWP